MSLRQTPRTLRSAERALLDYYARRAAEYERIYEKPERQEDLERLRALVAERLRGHDVLEIACGTGYWTAEIARVARTVLATDASAEVLELALAKPLPPDVVTFAVENAYDLENAPHRARPVATAAFAGFWWSHVPRRRLPAFLGGLHRRVGRGARVVLVDNRFVAGSSTPIAHRDAAGDTYQDRRLDDGRAYRVLKNFPSERELRDAVGRSGDRVEAISLTYYWMLSYEVA
jgi:demethylmenaquinone methyltransferase/2-methoxy-6-polyprenyl-1,4-benzoquinol methylase